MCPGQFMGVGGHDHLHEEHQAPGNEQPHAGQVSVKLAIEGYVHAA